MVYRTERNYENLNKGIFPRRWAVRHPHPAARIDYG